MIGSPSAYYNDPRSPSAFQTFRDNNKDRERIVVAGANDGQLHVFSAGDGQEKYSFIPPNLLPKLKSIVHSTHPADDEQKRQYFVDGPLTAADAKRVRAILARDPVRAREEGGRWESATPP